MDADGWRRILTSNSFGQSSTDICIALANVAKKTCVEPDQTNSLEAFLASRLIPLDKNPGLRPIGVGEVIRRIIGKSVIHTLKEDIIRSVGNLQVCAGHESGCEAAIHAMSQIFNEEDSEAVLLIDASNAFNAVNRKLFLHNVSVICPEIAVFVRNCYSLPLRLFIIGGSELKSCEGTTQGDPAAMAIYAIGIIPLLLMLVDQAEQLPGKKTKSVAYTDDFTGAGSIKNLLHWWNTLTTLGPLFGYHPVPTKCWLIVKPRMKDIALKTFENTGINITEDGKRHLGAVIGTTEYRENYVTQKVNNWQAGQQHDKKIKENKKNIRRSKHAHHHLILQRLRNDMSDEQRRLNEVNRQQGASTWLTTLPIKEEGYTINMNCFWDLLRLRYGWQLQRLQTTCECGTRFTLDHALSCKKGGFISLRHNQIRDLTANLLKTICHDVLIEPTLQQLTGESLHERTANITDDACLDIAARGFWISGQRAFFDIRVFNPMARQYESQELNKAYEINEREKKRQYNERILEVEHGSFTPLVMTALGGMGREGSKFYSRLSESIVFACV